MAVLACSSVIACASGRGRSNNARKNEKEGRDPSQQSSPHDRLLGDLASEPMVAVHPASDSEYEELQSVRHVLRLL